MKFIFVFILLVTLSIVNAIPHQLHNRATTFLPCNTGESPLDVTISPVPGRAVNNITIRGQLSQPVTTGSTISIAFLDANNQLLAKEFILDYCNIRNIECP